jgi:hypothetical protein
VFVFHLFYVPFVVFGFVGLTRALTRKRNYEVS